MREKYTISFKLYYNALYLFHALVYGLTFVYPRYTCYCLMLYLDVIYEVHITSTDFNTSRPYFHLKK